MILTFRWGGLNVMDFVYHVDLYVSWAYWNGESCFSNLASVSLEMGNSFNSWWVYGCLVIRWTVDGRGAFLFVCDSDCVLCDIDWMWLRTRWVIVMVVLVVTLFRRVWINAVDRGHVNCAGQYFVLIELISVSILTSRWFCFMDLFLDLSDFQLFCRCCLRPVLTEMTNQLTRCARVNTFK